MGSLQSQQASTQHHRATARGAQLAQTPGILQRAQFLNAGDASINARGTRYTCASRHHQPVINQLLTAVCAQRAVCQVNRLDPRCGDKIQRRTVVAGLEHTQVGLGAVTSQYTGEHHPVVTNLRFITDNSDPESVLVPRQFSQQVSSRHTGTYNDKMLRPAIS